MDVQFTPTDVVIVGGGLAGLTTACYLARAGGRVTLFEKAAELGGRAATQNYEGFIFNRGIHALYSGGATSRVLDELGVRYQASGPKKTFVLRQGAIYPMPADPITLLGSKLLDLGDKLELLRMFMSLPQLKAATLAGTSVADWLQESFRRLRVRELLAAGARTFVYSAALDLVSAEVFVDKLQRSLTHPICYIEGGWQTLVQGLRQAAEQAGARIHTGTHVAAVVGHNGQVEGVLLEDGRQVPARTVILATPPQEATRLVDDGAYPALRQIVARLLPAQVACLDVALRDVPTPTYPIIQDLDRARFMSTQSQYAPVAPPGGTLICSFKQLDPRQSTDPHADERELEDLITAALPRWRNGLVKRAYLPRIAAVGALPTTAGGGFAGRPGPRVPDLAGLYLAGDWIGAEGFLADASFASARLAAQLVLQSAPPAGATKERPSVAAR